MTIELVAIWTNYINRYDLLSIYVCFQAGINGKIGAPVPQRRPVVVGLKFVRDHAPMGASRGSTDFALDLQMRRHLAKG